jgi:hypothetical protein
MCADRELHDALYEPIHHGDASMSAQALAQVESQQVFPISFDTATPGVAPSAVAAIPQSSSGTTAPTQPLSLLVAPAQDASQSKSLVQEVLDALDASKVESQKVHKYLPDFFQKLREDLRVHREQTLQTPTGGPLESPATTVSSVLFAYQSVSLTSVGLSIRT